jgi:hypothetical protein
MESDSKDIGYIEDAFNCISDLYCAELHALSTFTQTNNKDWIDLAKLCRINRSELLYSISPENTGESYCFLKHLSGFTRNFQELGNRRLEVNDQEKAAEYFKLAEQYKKIFILLCSENNKGGKNV